MPSLTIENYVKTIYQICSVCEGQSASTGQVAQALDVSPGTVTSMLKTLSDSGLVTYTPYEGVLLTKAGTSLALRILRRHRLIELFLVETLGLGWDEVHEEAENMEHAVSDMLVDRIDQFLGNPLTDPHGDPIPRADGSLRQQDKTSCLANREVGSQFRLVRVLDQTPEFLRYLTDVGLPLGSEGKVVTNHRAAGVLQVSVESGMEVTLGRDAAKKLLVAETSRPG